MDLPKYEREYCCDECGLIWFDETTTSNTTTCPECGNSNRKGLIYACDTMAYAYAYNSIVVSLNDKGKKIHFHKEHPKYQKEQCICWSEYGESVNSGIKCSNCGREL